MTENVTTHDFRIRLLIVDDEQTIRRLAMAVGESLGFSCLEAENGAAALALLEEQPVHMVLTDMVMPSMSGIEFLEQVKRDFPAIEVAVMTGHGSVETAVQAMKLGAYDYIAKPFAPLDDLRLFLRRMADKVRLVEENLYLRGRATDLRATDLGDIERATIERVFSQVHGDKTLAGKMLGISRATLYRKLKRYQIGAREGPSQSTTLQ